MDLDDSLCGDRGGEEMESSNIVTTSSMNSTDGAGEEGGRSDSMRPNLKMPCK